MKYLPFLRPGRLSIATSSVLLALSGCGDSGSSESSSSSGSGGSASTTGSGAGTQGGGGTTGSFTGSGGNAGGNQGQNLTITPVSPTMDVVYGAAGQTQQFTALSAGEPVNAVWYLNTPEAGTIDASGLFTSNGAAGGDVTVTAAFGDEIATTILRVNLSIVDNQAGLTPELQGVLTSPGGQADGSMTSPYPYDKTVFPRAIPAPGVHVNGITNAEAMMVRVSQPGCSYLGFFPPSAQLTMNQAMWDALGTCSDGSDLEMEIAKLAGGQKYGPLMRTIRVATAKLHGTIYYNTYDSPLAGTGAMMRIKGSDTAPEVLVGNCTVCHSVASDGSTAAAANHYGPGGTFDLSSGQVNPPLVWQTPEAAAFGALYPQGGQVIVVQGAPGGSWPPNTPGTSGMYASELRTRDGVLVPDSGIEGFYAQTPVFSHDGTILAFTDRDPNNTGASTLALLDYDAVTQKFSNHRVLATPPAGRHYSWPAFTPDNKWLVIQDGVGEDLATWNSNTAKLRAINLETQEVLELGALNGDGYLPAGARDENLNFEPTILPISAGGYFWIMYTSRRTFGNVLTGNRDQTKRLWVSAFDVTGGSGSDPSRPGFYISGQELSSGNSRGFWALDPCKSNGQTCETGDECCGGFCNPSEESPGEFVCGEPDGSCSAEFEACTTAADCCDPALECIGGVCGSVRRNDR